MSEKKKEMTPEEIGAEIALLQRESECISERLDRLTNAQRFYTALKAYRDNSDIREINDLIQERQRTVIDRLAFIRENAVFDVNLRIGFLETEIDTCTALLTLTNQRARRRLCNGSLEACQNAKDRIVSRREVVGMRLARLQAMLVSGPS